MTQAADGDDGARSSARASGPRGVLSEGWAPLLVWLLAAALAAFLVTQHHEVERSQERELFDVRTATMAELLAGEVERLQEGLATAAVEALAGETVAPVDLRAVVRLLGFESGALFDDQGRYITSPNFREEAVGQDFTTRLEHVQIAEVEGRAAVSQGLVSPGLETTAVGFAAPYPTPHGRRIVTGVLTLRSGALADLLQLDLEAESARIDVVDRDGILIASTGAALPEELVPYEERHPATAAAIAVASDGAYRTDADGDQVYSSEPVSGTDWRLVLVDDAAALYGPLEEGQRNEWLVYALAALFVLLMSIAAARELDGRRRMEEELRALNADLEASVDRRTEALRAALEQARASEHAALRHVAVVEAASEAIIGHELDGTITSWNAAAEQLYGYSKQEAVGSSLLMLACEGHGDALLPSLGSDRPAAPVLTVTCDRDGERHDVEVSTAPITDDDGVLVGAASIHLDVTERRRALAASSRATALFESLFLVGPPQAIVAPDGAILEVNEQLCDMLGYPREELLGMTSTQVTDPMDREVTRTYMQQLRSGAMRSIQLRKRYRHRDGHEVIGLLHLTLVPGREGDDPVLVGVVQDITELSLAQQQLAEREAMLAGVTSSSANILTMYDAMGTCVFAAGAGLERIGETPETMIGSTFRSRHGERPEMVTAFRRALSGQSADVVTRYGNGVFDVRFRAVGDDDPPSYIALATTDITERQLAQDALERSERRFRALVQHAKDTIVQLDAQGTVLGVSEGVTAITGLTPAQVEGRNALDFLPPAFRSRARTDLARLSEGVAVSGQLSITGPDGEPLHVHYDAVDLRDDPAVGALVVTLHDETEHVLAQQERRRQAEELEDLNEELATALRVRDNILSATTHELRTPLTPMVGLLELIDSRFDALDKDQLREYFDVLRRNTDRLTGLVEDLLVATNLRTGTMKAIPEAVPVRDRVERALAGYPAMADAVVTGPDAVAWCQQEHLDQALNSLFANAARHGRAPYGVAVDVEEEGVVHITITDSGDGITDEVRDLLFEPFIQGSMGDQRTATRLGLGLPIARELLAANGGALDYERAATGGAAFRITLPLARSDEEAGAPTAHAHSAP